MGISMIPCQLQKINLSIKISGTPQRNTAYLLLLTSYLLSYNHSLFRMIFPDTVLGSSSRNTTILGYL